MATMPNFLGPSNPARSRNVDGERTINFYPEFKRFGEKSQIYLYPTPGHIPFVILDPGPVRCIWAENGRCFAISGAYLYEVFAQQTAIVRGQVAEDSKPATICSNGLNGQQLFITSGGLGYIYDLTADTLTQITDSAFPFPALSGAFINSYFIVLSYDKFQLSEIADGLQWSGLDVNQVSMTSDRKIAMVASHTELWLFGTERTEVWSNTNQGNNAFVPNPSAPIDHGIAAAASVALLDNTLFFVARDENGQGMVVRMSGYTPMRISTFALENVINKLPRIDDAIGWTYSQQGHLYYVLYLPKADTTWVYDVATGLWHERAIWDNDLMRWKPHVGRCHTFAFNRNLVGDRQSGAIYELRLDRQYDQLVLTDAA